MISLYIYSIARIIDEICICVMPPVRFSTIFKTVSVARLNSHIHYFVESFL